MNYIDFYQLKEQPFSIAVDNRFYYSSQQHASALLKLKYAAEHRKGLAVLIGEVGTGKTTLARQLLEELPEDQYESALLVVLHSAITSSWFLRKIAIQLGASPEAASEKSDLLTQVYNRLVDIYDEGKKAIVLIDEAQMLHNREVMEELRGMLNIELDGKKLITFILFGLPDLDDVLTLDRPLKQRMSIRYEFHSLTMDMTEEYVRYRLDVAGAQKALFTAQSLVDIHQYSKGIPRLINTICDNALLEGFLLKKEVIDEKMIQEVATDLKLIG
ncbi:MAG: ExeA family protein [Nitrospiria bacterium]